MKASGEFEVNMEPQDFAAAAQDGVALGRMSLKKSFTGDLAGNSQGEMLSAMTATEGSAGYVAIEQFVGSLNGKQGSFVLQHYGTMNRGADELILTIVPDSGAGELSGIAGKMNIRIEDGKHFYDLIIGS